MKVSLFLDLHPTKLRADEIGTKWENETEIDQLRAT
jgi:hypothetical protein